MEVSEVQALIEAGLPTATVTVTGDGSHFQALVVSTEFEGKSLLIKQKMVLATVNEQIISGELHAFSVKAHTPAEWEKASKLLVGSS
jgi:acid stress-induced BolA-like protein IbaG/YrbA